MLEDLQDAAKLWERRGRRPEDTLSRDDLATVRHRAGQLGLAVPRQIQDYFDASAQRHLATRRRRRTATGIALAIAVCLAVPAFVAIGKYLSREQLIESNTGTLDLVIIPFDSVGLARVPSGIAALPELSLALHEARPDNLHEHGVAFPPEHVGILAPQDFGLIRIQRIRAPGGLVFLKIDGRGRPGERCGSSWIRIQAFPGYRTYDVEQIELWVPTCRASH